MKMFEGAFEEHNFFLISGLFSAEPIFIAYFLEDAVTFSEEHILTKLMRIFWWAWTLFDLSAEYIVIIKSKMAFFDSNVVVDSMSVIIPYSCSCKFYFAG